MKRLRWPSWMPIDPYILLLLGTVGLAALFPARGAAADVASGASTAAIAFLFFLYGVRLSTREALDGLNDVERHAAKVGAGATPAADGIVRKLLLGNVEISLG